MTAPRLEVVDLTLTVGAGAAGLTLLSGLSLTLAPGASLALTGRSGSGKSSLLHCLGGLLTPQEGTVTWQPAGAAPSLLSAAEEGVRAAFRRQHLGFVFQFFHLVPTLTALENVAFMAELAGMGAPKERAEAMLEAVGLADRRHVFPESLSGGEQQRVAVARALVHAPAAVLADEPTGNLDAQTAETVAEVLFTQTRAAGASLVLVTHDPALAAQADRTLALGGAMSLLWRARWRALRREPGQSALLILSLALGVAVVVAVDLVNAASRAAMATASAQLQGASTHRIDGPGGSLSLDAYGALRRAWRAGTLLEGDAPVMGFAPILEGRLPLPDGSPLRLLGIDPFSQPASGKLLGGRAGRRRANPVLDTVPNHPWGGPSVPLRGPGAGPGDRLPPPRGACPHGARAPAWYGS